MITLKSLPIMVNYHSTGQYSLTLESNGKFLAIKEIGPEAKMLCGDEGTIIEVVGSKLNVIKQGGSFICKETNDGIDTVFLGRVFKHIIVGDRFFSGVY